MKRTEKQKYLEMAPSSLQKELNTLRVQLSESKLKLHSGQLKDTSVFKKTRQSINLLLNLIYRHEHKQLG
ncbi:MAG: 50S ribosomal protein L29 [Candidatus Shapirobacteria bacterium]